MDRYRRAIEQVKKAVLDSFGVTELFDEVIDEHDLVEVVRCKDCKHRFVDGENVRFNVCELNHNKVQSDDWFCADGERRESDDRER